MKRVSQSLIFLCWLGSIYLASCTPQQGEPDCSVYSLTMDGLIAYIKDSSAILEPIYIDSSDSGKNDNIRFKQDTLLTLSCNVCQPMRKSFDIFEEEAVHKTLRMEAIRDDGISVNISNPPRYRISTHWIDLRHPTVRIYRADKYKGERPTTIGWYYYSFEHNTWRLYDANDNDRWYWYLN